MFFDSDRSSLRRFLLNAWRKKLSGAPLEPLEQMIAHIVGEHPEYHKLLEDDAAVESDFDVSGSQKNPFLHLAMHVAIQEQVSADRPPGIRSLYAELRMSFGDSHALEHAMMECLGKSLWQAQRSGTSPDEQAYFECVRGLKKRDVRSGT